VVLRVGEQESVRVSSKASVYSVKTTSRGADADSRERRTDAPDNEEVGLGHLVLEHRRADQVVVEGRHGLARVHEPEHLERRLVGAFEQERLADLEL